MTTLRFIENLRDLAVGRDVILSDIWGVVHNGLESFPDACAALKTFRSQGGSSSSSCRRRAVHQLANWASRGVCLISVCFEPACKLSWDVSRAVNRARRRLHLCCGLAPIPILGAHRLQVQTRVAWLLAAEGVPAETQC